MKKVILCIGILLILGIVMFAISYAVEYKYPDLVSQTTDRYGKVTTSIHFAAREITQATDIGVMEGYPDGTFRPNATITRAEFIKMLIGLATNRTFDFENINSKYNEWYGPYVTIAEMQGIIEKNAYTRKRT